MNDRKRADSLGPIGRHPLTADQWILTFILRAENQRLQQQPAPAPKQAGTRLRVSEDELRLISLGLTLMYRLVIDMPAGSGVDIDLTAVDNLLERTLDGDVDPVELTSAVELLLRNVRLASSK